MTYENSVTLNFGLIQSIIFILAYFILVPMARALWFVPLEEFMMSLLPPSKKPQPLLVKYPGLAPFLFILSVGWLILVGASHIAVVSTLLLWDTMPDGSHIWNSIVTVFSEPWLLFTYLTASGLYLMLLVGEDLSKVSRRRYWISEIVWATPIVATPILLKAIG